MEGHTTQTLYGKRTWHGQCTSPLLLAGQYEDAESGWAYNRFRYYSPTLGASSAAYWFDVLGLVGRSHTEHHARAVLAFAGGKDR